MNQVYGLISYPTAFGNQRKSNYFENRLIIELIDKEISRKMS
jgi:hypothetical protein